MVSTFLHEDKPQPPDELAGDRPPFCAQCGEEMWTQSVSTIVTDNGVDGTYTYECKHCGAKAKVHRHSVHADHLAIVPDIGSLDI
jgi:DNA-directed RNA polymerase subunit RPC12/RpoP